MDFSAKCSHCSQLLYGPVSYCPFCGIAFVSATDAKQKLETLRSEISSLLGKGEYSPGIRESIWQKGKAIGITEAAADSLLLAVLKEKGFSPVKDGANNPLAVEWCTAEKKPKEVIPPTQPEPPTVEEPQPKEPEKPAEVKPTTSKPIERPKIPEPVPPPPPPPTPVLWKVVVPLGIAVIVAGLFYMKRPPVSKPEQGETKPQRTVEQPKETRTEVPEAPKSPVEQNANPQPATAPNLDAEREKIKQEAEKEALAKVEAERQRQEQINRQREIENQRQEQAARQREIDDYLSDGKRFFENGKYELCIEKMKEVLRRDRNNREAERYVQMAQQRLGDAKRQFQNLKFGGQE